MIILEGQIQKVRSGKWAELEELGFPGKRRCRSLVGGFLTDMLIVVSMAIRSLESDLHNPKEMLEAQAVRSDGVGASD